MSLRDQLVKAGLVTKEKAKKVKREQGRKRHQAHRDRAVRQELEAERLAREQSIMAQDEAKKEADRERNRALQAEQAKREARLEARQLIDTNRLEIPKEAEQRFNFTSDGTKIRYVRVTEKISDRLAKGELAICRNDRDGFDYPIVPLTVAERLLEIEKIEGGRWVYFLADPDEVSDAEDEWAAWDAYEASLKEGN